MLHSTDIRARGVALDQYTYAEAQGRWGADNPMTRFDDEVLAQARAMLAVTPDPAVPLADQPRVIACWNSALGVLAFHARIGDTADLARIVEVIDSTLAGDLLDTYAFLALEVRLVDADEATCARVGAWLAATFADARLPTGVRISAVQPFMDDRFSARLGQRATIAALLADPDIRLSIQAAWALADRDGPNEAVRQTVAGWPDDAPYPASEVRDLLADADELARARASLAAPAGPPPVVAAFKTLMEYGNHADVPRLLAIFDDSERARDVAEYLLAKPADVEDPAAFGAALNRCLRGADEPTIHQANARLVEVFTDARLPDTVRALAIQPFWDHDEDRERPDALTGLLDPGDLRLSTAAAFALVERPESEARVRQVVAKWPGDAPYPANRVRKVLAGIDALAAARELIADPPDDPSADLARLADAVQTVLRKGDDTDGPKLLALLDGDGVVALFSRADREAADALARKLRSALRRRLPDGARDPRYAAAVDRLQAMLPEQP